MDGQLLELVGVFLGGALPWLEAIIVIPIGIAAGLPPVAVVIAGVTGNLLTVAVAAVAGEQIRAWWQRRRGDRSRSRRARTTRRSRWTQHVVDRWGLPGLAVLGPLGLGTQVSVLVGISLGHSARTSFTWIAVATLLWSIAAAVMASLGLQVAGFGAV